MLEVAYSRSNLTGAELVESTFNASRASGTADDFARLEAAINCGFEREDDGTTTHVAELRQTVTELRVLLPDGLHGWATDNSIAPFSPERQFNDMSRHNILILRLLASAERLLNSERASVPDAVQEQINLRRAGLVSLSDRIRQTSFAGNIELTSWQRVSRALQLRGSGYGHHGVDNEESLPLRVARQIRTELSYDLDGLCTTARMIRSAQITSAGRRLSDQLYRKFNAHAEGFDRRLSEIEGIFKRTDITLDNGSDSEALTFSRLFFRSLPQRSQDKLIRNLIEAMNTVPQDATDTQIESAGYFPKELNTSDNWRELLELRGSCPVVVEDSGSLQAFALVLPDEAPEVLDQRFHRYSNKLRGGAIFMMWIHPSQRGTNLYDWLNERLILENVGNADLLVGQVKAAPVLNAAAMGAHIKRGHLPIGGWSVDGDDVRKHLILPLSPPLTAALYLANGINEETIDSRSIVADERERLGSIGSDSVRDEVSGFDPWALFNYRLALRDNLGLFSSRQE